MSVGYLTTANGLNSINLKHANKWLRPHQSVGSKTIAAERVQSVNATHLLRNALPRTQVLK